jgi:fibronectin-binding autotransporter adhesin
MIPRSFLLATLGGVAVLCLANSAHATTIIYTDSSTPVTTPINTTLADPITLAITFGSAIQSGVISGDGSITKTGAGTISLTGTNTFSGPLAINGGTISASNSSALGSGGLSFDGGTLTTTTGMVLTKNTTLNAGGATFALSNGFFTLNGNVSGAGGLTKNGTSILTLNGAHTYTGSTTISGGILKFADNGATASTIATSGLAIASGAKVIFENSQTYAGTVTGAGVLEHDYTGTTILTGAASHTGGTNIVGGVIQLGNGGTTGSLSGNVALSGGGTLAFNRSNATSFGGVISGAGSVTKSGAGTLTLSATNTYDGGTTINGGLVNFASLGNFGSGTIALNGGGLQWATGNTLDVTASSQFNRVLGAGGGTFDTNGNNVTFGSALSGTGALSKAGSGTLTLAGTNTYEGGTNLPGGTLSISSAANLGSGTLAINDGTLRNTATLTLAQPVTLGTSSNYFETQTGDLTLGPLSGGGGFTKRGDNTLVLTGENTYTGITTIELGYLKLNNASVQTPNLVVGGTGGLILSGTNTISGSIFATGGIQLTDGTTTILGAEIALNSSAGPNDTSRWFQIGANATLQLGDGVLNPYAINSGTFYGPDSSTIVVNTVQFNLTVGAKIFFERLSTFVKNGDQSLILAAENDFSSSSVVLNEGGLWLANRNALGGLDAHLIINGGELSTSSVNFEIDLENQVTVNGDFTLGRFTNLLGNIEVTNDVKITLGEGDGSAPSGNQARIGGNISGGAHSLTFDSIANADAKLILSGTNTYTGATTINGGNLVVDGSLSASSAVAINNGGTLSGHGSVGPITINSGGTISPGNSPGTMTSLAETWNGGGIYVWELNDATGTKGATSGTGWDWLNITGGLTIASTELDKFTIQITSLGLDNLPGSAANVTGEKMWVLATASGGITGFDPSNILLDLSHFTNDPGNFSVSVVGNDLILSYSAIPEPSTYAVAIASLLGAIILLRRRSNLLRR